MAENVQSDIIINVDTSVGIAEIKNLQRQLSSLNAQLMKSGAAQAKSAQDIQRNLINNINATGQFAASVKNISSTTETFTSRLEKNKLGMGEYFKYAGGASKTFGKLFKSEFDTIEKVARERVKTLQTQYIKLGRDANGALKSIAVRPLTLDMENLATKTAMAAQKQQLMNQLLKQGSTNLLNFGKNTQWAGRQLMVGFSIPLAYLGTVAAKTFMEMEEQAIKFKRVYGDAFTATEETDKIVKQVQSIAKEFTKYGVAAEKTMKMAADAAAMGKQGADLLAQVNQATRLAVLGGVEQEQALETTISLTNAFGIAADKLSGKIDFLNAVENQTVTSIEDLTIAVPKAGPVIQQLGGDVEDLAFFLTAMKEGGINASEGANALKSGLAALINPTATASKFLAGFGVNIKGIVEANKGDVKGLVVDFASALDTLDPLNRAKAIEQLFGKFQFARLSTLFKNVVGQGTQAERVLKLSASTAQELAILSERELKRVEDSPMYKFKKTIEDLKISLIPLGEAFLKAITPIVEFAKTFLDKFNDLSDGAKQFAVLMTTVVAGIGPILLMSFGLIANGVANVIKMFSGIRNIFAGAGGSAQALGSQTEYLTQQQLEAAAVAASLDQTHSKLIQTFSVEESGVNRLAQAYARAVVAQSKLAGVPIGGPVMAKTKTPRKYASGVVSVPGPKGAGDIVPAMLSPGEAVIPADMSSRYSGLINGMVNGTIPAFNKGTTGVGSPRSRNLMFPRELGLQASHMAPGTGVLSPQQAKKTMNRELDKLIRQGVIDETLVDRSLISKISQNVRLNSQSVGMLTGTFNQWFTNEKSVKSISDIVRELSKTKGMVGGSLIPNLEYLSAGGKGAVGSVKDSTTSKYLKDLDREFRGMVANSKVPNLSEKQIQAIFKKAQISAESKIVSFEEKASIKKANIFGRSTLSPAVPGQGQTGRTNLQTPMIGFTDAQKLTREKNRAKIAKLSGVVDRWLPKNSKYITGYESQVDRLKNLFKTLPLSESEKLAKAITSSDGSSEALDKIISGVTDGKKIDVSAKSKTRSDIKPKKVPQQIRQSSQSINLSEVLASNNITAPAKNGKAGIIAKLFGRKFARGTASVTPFKNSKFLGNMMKRSTVSTRMPAETLIGMLKSGDTRYRSAFETGTGVDYLTKHGTPKPNQARDRRMMEMQAMNIPWDADVSERPTYGSVANRNPMSRMVNRLFGGITGKQFNQVANPMSKHLDIYGDTSLIGKRSIGKRSTMYGNDILKSYLSNTSHFSYRKQQGIEFPQMYGPNVAGIAGGNFQENLGRKFGQSYKVPDAYGGNSVYSNPGLPYLETYTKGGFDLKEISKIISKNPDAVPLIKQALIAQGLKIPVRAERKGLMGKIFGFNNGVVSVPGPKGAGDVVPAMLSPGEAVIPSAMAKKYGSLVNSMVDGTVPGYAKGKKSKFNFGSNYGPIARDEPLTAPTTSAEVSKGLAGAMSKAFKDNPVKKALSGIATTIAGSVSGGIKDAKISTLLAKKSVKDFGARYKEEFASTREEYATGQTARFEQKNKARLDKKNAKAQKTYGESYAAAGMVPRADGKLAYAAGTVVDDKKVGGRLVSQNDAAQIRAEKDAQTKSDRAEFRKRGMGKAAGVGGALASAGMMGMMAGDQSGVAQGAMVAGTAMSMLPMLTNPAGIAIAAIAGVGLGLYVMSENLKKAREEATKTSVALSSGATAMKKLGEFANTVTPTEVMDRIRQQQRAPYEIQTGKNTFGGSYLASESGKELLNQATSQKLELGGEGAAKRIGIQLSQAIAGNIITKDQAFSIANNLGEAMKDYGFAVDVNATMTSFIGPNGEDLTKDPLKVQAEIIAARQETVTGAGNAKEILTGQGNAFEGTVKYSTTELAGAEIEVAQVYKDIFDMGKQNLDQLELEHVKRLEILKAAGDLAGIKKENDKYDIDKTGVLETNRKALEAENKYISGLEASPSTEKSASAIVDSLEAGIKKQFEGADSKIRDMANRTIEDISNQWNPFGKTLSQADKATLIASITVENIDTFKQVQELFPVNDKTEMWEKIAQITVSMGSAAQAQLMSIIPGFGTSAAGKAKAEKFVKVVADIQVKDPKGAKDILDTLEILQKTKGVDIGQFINDDGTVNDKFKKLDKALKAIDKKFNAKKGKKLVYSIDFKNDTTGFKLSKAAQEYFDSLPADQQKVYTTTYFTLKDTIDASTPEGKAQIAAYKQAHGMGGTPAVMSDSAAITGILEEQSNIKTAESFNADGTPKTTEDDLTDPGGGTADVLDDLLKKLKNIRKASVNAAGGMKELLKQMTGKKPFEGFAGIEQQLNLKGYNEEFISFMSDADKATQDRFMTIKNGVVTLKTEGVALQRLFDAITLGNFERSIQQSINASNRTLAARKDLIAGGMKYADAVEAATDAGLAEALAAARATKGTALKAAAIKNVIKLYNDAKVAAENALTAEEKFTQAYDKAMNNFGTLEKKIDIDFRISTDSFEDAIVSAQADIDNLTFKPGGLDDLQSGLTYIGWQEDEINKKYDLRNEALSKIESANSRISNQQRGQLTLADALSKGDISAAAKAVQDIRDTESKDAIQNQRDLIEQSRTGELAGITTTVNGVKKTRATIEAEILTIEKSIHAIEETRLETSRESIRLATVARDTSLESLNDQKVKWEQLQNNIELSALGAWDYVAALKAANALALEAQLQNAAPKKAATTVADTTVIRKGTYAEGLAKNPWTKEMGSQIAPILKSMGYFADGGFIPKGTDTVPAMLTPGEFVMTKYAVEDFGVDKLKSINSGTYSGDSVYNYNLSVNTSGSNINADDIAKTVMMQIKQVNSQKLRGNSF